MPDADVDGSPIARALAGPTGDDDDRVAMRDSLERRTICRFVISCPGVEALPFHGTNAPDIVRQTLDPRSSFERQHS